MLLSCQKEEVVQPIDSSFKNVQRIVRESCYRCHKDYDLSSEAQFLATSEIVPGRSDKSAFYKVLDYANLTKDQMPPDEKLPWNDVLSIKYWIDDLDSGTSQLENHYQPKKISPDELYMRCYSHLTGSLPTNKKKFHSREEAIHSCLEMFKNTKLVLDKKINYSNEQIKIINQFSRLHYSFFIPFDFFRANQDWATQDVIDQYGVSYYYILSLFDEDFSFKDIFKFNQPLEGIRLSKVESTYFSAFVHGQRFEKKSGEWRLGDDKKINDPWSPQLVERGELIGIRRIPIERDKISAYVPGHRPTKAIKKDVKIHKHFGGGVLGSQQYLLAYANRDMGVKSDGKVKMNRAWSKSILTNFLCRDLPVIGKKDVLGLVKKNSTIPFKRKTNCMMCHYTMDSLSGLLRNIESFQTNSFEVPGEVLHSRHMRSFHHKDLKAEVHDEDSKDFHLSLPSGAFIYRDLQGRLHNKKLDSLNDLGEYLVGVPEVYSCIVSRYYEFFTGHRVKIEKKKEGSKQGSHLRFVSRLADELKQHQSLRETISSILKSDVYAYEFFINK